jgi:iron complex outermembrane receptor protein
MLILRYAFAFSMVAVLLLPPAGPAGADELAGQAGYGEEAMLFQEIPSVYGASKYEQKVTEAPSSVSIITSSEIKKYGYRTLADILRSVRSFYITYDRNYSYVGVRGFGRPGDYNSRILLLIDGHRTNDNIYNQAFVGAEAIIDVDLIERVEVIRGPGSSLYGSNAFFAVINVITRRGDHVIEDERRLGI